MSVSDAVDHRSSIRAFLGSEIPNETIRDLLAKASRSPSGGNVQPWRIYVVNGDSMTRFREFIKNRPLDTPEYDIYPPGLVDPYRTARFNLGEQMYEILGIPREDRDARLHRMAENYNFFGAPAAIFCFFDRSLGSPQWADLGMFLQTFMLLAAEAGLDTCTQEAWSNHHTGVTEFVGAPDNEQLFCGMAIGHRDPDDPVNGLRAERFSVDEFTKWV
ncbi:MAG: nitroreductase [Actinomycetia bacterium]|nr:nitroreductase [Actinomycetes bacterium]MCP4960078.1 nitroreductase [Actinomycetes bacterium]